ncbi:MAG: hypothetical protein M3297_16620, partial [Thermoproteota archaeon]|nr:hypothetical protein [Thermoproteota archaeon]
MISPKHIKMLNNSKCALFDIDGVLVDVRRSYNLAIRKTVDFVLKNMGRESHAGPLVSDALI